MSAHDDEVNAVDIFDKRLIINTGKGGVGKTTLSAAIGLAAARRGKRVLIMQLGVKDRMARLFGAPFVGTDPVEVEDNLFAVNVTPESALEEYALLKLKLKTLYKAVFENRFVRTFLRVIPGLNELFYLGKAWYEEAARDAAGRPRWDMIVIDAPATGHGVFFLQIPRMITSMITSGPMYDEAAQIQRLVEDKSRTALNLVTLVEEMPVNETIELAAKVERELRVPLGFVVCNALYTQRFQPRQADLLRRIEDHWPDDGGHLDRLLDAGLFRLDRVEMQRRHLERLDDALTLPRVTIPYYFTERFNFQTIARIADELERQNKAILGGERAPQPLPPPPPAT